MNNVHHDTARLSGVLRLALLTAVFALACGLPDSLLALLDAIRRALSPA